MTSIYHFLKSLTQTSEHFREIDKLTHFPFNQSLLSCNNVGRFPDLILKLNSDNELFTGGEFIELKDNNSYSISSFNSTIPTGQKNINDILTTKNSKIQRQMEAAGDDIYSLLQRDVFYLIRGRDNKHKTMKIVLVHGSFFETISVNKLISGSFSQILEERIRESGIEVNDETKKTIIDIFSEQKSFSKVRHVDKASVKLRFRVMTEAKAEGNILSTAKYPEIEDDTLNLVLPCHDDETEKLLKSKFEKVFGKTATKQFKIFKFKHHFNGYFLAFQQKIK